MAQDMRSWINLLDEAGLLARIKKPVDPRTQMGALLWQTRDRALLFENLAGFPGWPSAPCTSTRWGLRGGKTPACGRNAVT